MTSSLTPTYLNLSGPTTIAPAWTSERLPGKEPAAGYSRLWLHHRLTTEFVSADMPGLVWDNKPDLNAQGFELAWSGSQTGDLRFGLRGGHASGSGTRNALTSNGYSVVENVDTSINWGTFELQYWPLAFFHLDAQTGGLNYAVDTRVRTDAPTYTYSGITGDRTVMLLGLGGGLTSAFRFPLQLYVTGRYNWTFGGGDPLEHSVVQLGTGLEWRF